ncbi:MAG: hypothetical protein K1X50_21030 [Candidatus Promineofilum sp.]|nr:hypothetical protein [Promineifilum sp.]MCW5862716.1 hypothetical protein [Anaerolineae bacterium]
MTDETQGLYDMIAGERGPLSKLLSKIPGFKGYMEKESRRDADQLLRDTISGRLQQTRLDLADVLRTLSRDIILGIEYAEPIGRADNQLMGLINKIKDAPQGYAGFFDAVKVKEDDLARLYAFDEQMLTQAEQIAADVAALHKTVENGLNIHDAVVTLTNTLRAANEAFGKRQEVLNQVGVDAIAKQNNQ